MRSFLVRKINNFTKTLSLRAKVPNTYGTRLYIYDIYVIYILYICYIYVIYIYIYMSTLRVGIRASARE